MANPRKFSEKIALHNQKQAEETAAFEKIMREVSDATSKVRNVFLFFWNLFLFKMRSINKCFRLIIGFQCQFYNF